MNDEELDALLSEARGDVPSPAELDALGARLGLSPGPSGGAPPPPPGAGIAGRVLAGRALAALLAALVPVTSWLAWSRSTTPAASSHPSSASAPGEAADIEGTAFDDPAPASADSTHEAAQADSPATEPRALEVVSEAPRSRPRLRSLGPAPTANDRAPDPSSQPIERARHAPPAEEWHFELASPANHGAEPARESEVSILGRASHALRSGDPIAARDALEEHAQAYPTGVLTEERESLEVELALRSGAASADAALEAFRRRHPRSGHLPRLERLASQRPGP